MDPFFLNQVPNDSQYSRSRPNSRASFTGTNFQTVEGTGDSNLSNIELESVSSRSTSGHSNSYRSPISQVPSTFISAPTPISQLYSPHPLLSESSVDSEWSLFASTETSEPHCVLTESIEDMSILGVQYDSRFEAGSRPSSYPWPALNIGDMDDQYQNQHLGPMRNYGESQGNAAFSTRSLSSSPPRNLLNTEHRELKRQRDARRNNKIQMRREKSENGSYTTSIVNTPEMIPGGLVNYSSSVPPLSLAAEVQSNISPHGYIAPYQASYPPAMRSNSGHEMYTSDFAIPPSYPVDHYQLHYDASASDSSQSVYPSPRPTPLSSTSEVPSLYQSSRTSQGSPIQTINHSHLQNQAVQHQHNQNLSTEPVRVVQSRPKPQCWEHGCNGRQFSTFSNLLRHQREKSGVASKSMCPKCGAEFTRTTARNGHMAHEKCKPRNE